LITKEVKFPCKRTSLFTHLLDYGHSDNNYQDTARHTEGLSGAAEAGLHQGDSASIGFAIH
jgi:hypothetical protein